MSAAILAKSFVLTLLLTPAAIRLSRKFKIFDLPSPRKIHQEATPRLGGLAVYLAILLSLAGSGVSWEFVLAATVLFAAGLWEDVKGLSALARLTLQLAAAIIVIYGGVCFDFHGVIFSALYTGVWIVGMINAMNYLDGVDGLAATLGLIGAGLFSAVSGPMPLTASLAGACLGFLPYNWRPARVFLGDGGSTLIGFSLAVLGAAYGSAAPSPTSALCVPILILGIPIFDMAYTTFSRVSRGDVRTFTQWLEYAGKDHVHHRLLNRNLSAAQVVGVLACINLCLGVGALAIVRLSR